MALTKEERSQLAKRRILERREEKEEMERKYPSALIHRYGKENGAEFLQIRLHSKEPLLLTIRSKGNWFYAEPEYPDVQTTYVRLDDPYALAGLIRGLVCRYNSMISRLNEEIEATPSIEAARTFENVPRDLGK